MAGESLNFGFAYNPDKELEEIMIRKYGICKCPIFDDQEEDFLDEMKLRKVPKENLEPNNIRNPFVRENHNDSLEKEIDPVGSSKEEFVSYWMDRIEEPEVENLDDNLGANDNNSNRDDENVSIFDGCEDFMPDKMYEEPLDLQSPETLYGRKLK